MYSDWFREVNRSWQYYGECNTDTCQYNCNNEDRVEFNKVGFNGHIDVEVHVLSRKKTRGKKDVKF